MTGRQGSDDDNDDDLFVPLTDAELDELGSRPVDIDALLAADAALDDLVSEVTEFSHRGRGIRGHEEDLRRIYHRGREPGGLGRPSQLEGLRALQEGREAEESAEDGEDAG